MLIDVGHIVVADDDPALRRMVTRYFEERDIPTKSASNKTELNRYFEETNPTLNPTSNECVQRHVSSDREADTNGISPHPELGNTRHKVAISAKSAIKNRSNNQTAFCSICLDRAPMGTSDEQCAVTARQLRILSASTQQRIERAHSRRWPSPAVHLGPGLATCQCPVPSKPGHSCNEDIVNSDARNRI